MTLYASQCDHDEPYSCCVSDDADDDDTDDDKDGNDESENDCDQILIE
jgi:hypothetical protein